MDPFSSVDSEPKLRSTCESTSVKPNKMMDDDREVEHRMSLMLVQGSCLLATASAVSTASEVDRAVAR